MSMLDSFIPRSGRMLIHRHHLPTGEPIMVNGVWIPERRREAFAVAATVLRVAPDVDDIHPGDDVWIPEFAGLPIYDGEVETAYFVIGSGDVLAVCETADVEAADSR
jgi:co-chaperonin GroES (HSP10)